MALTVDANPSKTDMEYVRDSLTAYNNRFIDDEYHYFCFTVKNEADDIIGGTEGCVTWGRLHIGNLWVTENYRHQGAGSQLMAVVEALARQRHCRGIDVDTFSFQSPGFYEKLGFTKMGEIPDFQNDHHRMFYSKRL
ncbi:GNAT family N-acetyltransferase [Leptothoe kymatousa]|uniref:GNAT family N-acetyltransferase n=1 Tax=Leptothoe kymatousa TAU-MAC 1615 TaxID=2364775 RepID=A0ABS5Y6N9_9CYAN|nr:GNAT family N-acetyltransferase [Leptothoe kymatousa]MBT9313493.1 GNAT family N-acetyltransferase [Leptothoe kymatousa TAU-MAC 1615]